VEIASATLRLAPCPAALDCRHEDVISVNGTLAGVSEVGEESVYALIKPAASSTYRVGAEVRPSADGE
jgi:hypothetical protein